MERSEAGTEIQFFRRKIIVGDYITNPQTVQENRNPRGKCTGWNDGMTRRIRAYAENFRQDFRVMVTLTYPAEYPSSGRQVKAHWRAFVERLRRRGWFYDQSLIWVLEFQERGAPHFHFIATGFIEKDWVSQAWAEITQGNIATCSRCEWIISADAAGAYLAKYLGKADQKEIPPGFDDVGRMWGHSGRRLLAGCPAIPCVVATTPRGGSDRIKQLEVPKTIRKVETLSGKQVFYGSEEEIKKLWQRITASIAPTVLDGIFPGGSALRTAGESFVTLATPESVTRKYVSPSNHITQTLNAGRIATAKKSQSELRSQ